MSVLRLGSHIGVQIAHIPAPPAKTRCFLADAQRCHSFLMAHPHASENAVRLIAGNHLVQKHHAISMQLRL